MAKEIGIPKSAPKSVKVKDEKTDKAKGVKEGSKADMATDKNVMMQYLKKKKKM